MSTNIKTCSLTTITYFENSKKQTLKQLLAEAGTEFYAEKITELEYKYSSTPIF